MLLAKLYQTEEDVDRRLAAFDVTRQELVNAISAVAAERNTTVSPVDPLGAAGQLSYIAGTRYLRLTLLSKGYEIDRGRNIESVVHRKRGISIAYQNVDLACGFTDPKAISGKKSASARMIGDAQGSMFSSEDLPAAIDRSRLAKLPSSVWYLCASFSSDGDIRAELSLPATIRKGNFHGFLERIFLIQRGEFEGFKVPDFSDRVEAEPLIARR